MLRDFYKLILVIVFSICAFHWVIPVAQGADHRKLFNKLYIDFKGEKPERTSTRLESLNLADTEEKLRTELNVLMEEVFFGSSFFAERLKKYFNASFSLNSNSGKILPDCSVSDSGTCLNVPDIQDFRDEIAMTLAMRIYGPITEPAGGEISDCDQPQENRFDIRKALTSTKTVITGRMAKLLSDNPDQLDRLGIPNIDRTKLTALASNANYENKWCWIERDESSEGVATGTPNHRETHAGVLTTPAYLKHNKIHISRAYAFHSWFMCREPVQISSTASTEPKLKDRKPCSDCHSLLEPLGSFWVNWRPAIDSNNLSASWILDGVSRLDESNLPLPDHGVVPIDTDVGLHSRTADGTFRGVSGKGVSSLADTATEQSDFAQCMTTHMWQFIQGRKVDSSEAGWIKVLSERLKTTHNWNLRKTIVDIVLTDAYYRDEAQP